MRQKKILFFALGGLILGIILILSGCGQGKQRVNVDTGPYALEFPLSLDNEAAQDYSLTLVMLTGRMQNPDYPAYEDLPYQVPKYVQVFNPYVVCPESNSFTVEAWIRPTVHPRNEQSGGILSVSREISFTGFNFYLWDQAGTGPSGCRDSGDGQCVKFYSNNGGATDRYATAVADVDAAGINLYDGNWHHVAAVVDGNAGTITIYVDGDIVPGADADHANPASAYPIIEPGNGKLFCRATGTLGTPEDGLWGPVPAYGDPGAYVNAAAIGTGFTNFFIVPTLPPAVKKGLAKEQSPTKPGSRFYGLIDEVRFWSDARTEFQINAYKNREINVASWYTSGANDALKGYWKFNEGTGIMALDSSGMMNHGKKVLCPVFDDPYCGLAGEPLPGILGGWVATGGISTY